MITIASLRADFYHMPLPVVLTDSTHGEMKYFELITVRLADSDGGEGLGYTYTVGAGGGAIVVAVPAGPSGEGPRRGRGAPRLIKLTSSRRRSAGERYRHPARIEATAALGPFCGDETDSSARDGDPVSPERACAPPCCIPGNGRFAAGRP